MKEMKVTVFITLLGLVTMLIVGFMVGSARPKKCITDRDCYIGDVGSPITVKIDYCGDRHQYCVWNGGSK